MAPALGVLIFQSNSRDTAVPYPLEVLRMRARLAVPLIAGAALAAAAPPVCSQQPAPQQAALEVGQPAPDFALTGATRFGVLKDPVRLSSLRGKTVVIAFFFKARTRG
jgi:hypothetical protein